MNVEISPSTARYALWAMYDLLVTKAVSPDGNVKADAGYHLKYLRELQEIVRAEDQRVCPASEGFDYVTAVKRLLGPTGDFDCCECDPIADDAHLSRIESSACDR